MLLPDQSPAIRPTNARKSGVRCRKTTNSVPRTLHGGIVELLQI